MRRTFGLAFFSLIIATACGRKFVGDTTSDAAVIAIDGLSDGPGNWCQPEAATVYVHALLGSDTNNGSCATPFKSISKAVATTNGNVALNIIRVGGSTSGAPFVYGANETGEVFPLNFATKLQLIGDGKDHVSVNGGGPVAGQDDQVMVVANDVTIQGINVTGSKGGMYVASGTLTTKLMSITNCANTGIGVHQNAALASETTIIAGNQSGLWSESKRLTLTNSEVREQRGAGIVILADGLITSQGTRYTNNGFSGIQLIRDGKAKSTLDIFDNNANGISMNDRDNLSTGAEVTGSVFTNNVIGVSVGFNFNVVMRNCRVLSNRGSGIQIESSATIDSVFDLGTATQPGGNTLQSAVGGNVGAGVCNLSPYLVTAARNTFRDCPATVTNSPTCTGAANVSGNVVASCL
jgi:hypothetical protein